MQHDRGRWSSRLGFVLAAAGSAIGLGNLWKFPYITWHNEGGVFVLTYLICICVVGLPIMMAEILVGKKTQKGAVGALREAVGPRWAFVGGWGVMAGFVILGYYSVIAGWALRNFGKCVAWSLGEYPGAAAIADEFGAFIADWRWEVSLSMVFSATTMFVVYAGVGKGIERVSKLLMPMLLLILLLLLGSALFMPGAADALRFLFVPRLENLTMVGVLEALGHSFFTLSLGMGAMITYGSYLSREHSVVRSSITVVALDTLIALAATVIMFSVIFSVEGMRENVGKSTVGMLFTTLPDLFYTIVPLGKLLAPLFYALVCFAALTSTISLLEVVAAYFIDERRMTRAAATLLCGGSILVLTLLCSLSFGAWGALSGFEIFPGKPGLFQTLDHLAANWLLPIGGFFITLGVGWFMTRESSEVELVDEDTPGWFYYGIWRLFMRYVAPIAVAAIIVAVISGKDFS